jgi:TolA-binding protein
MANAAGAVGFRPNTVVASLKLQVHNQEQRIQQLTNEIMRMRNENAGNLGVIRALEADKVLLTVELEGMREVLARMEAIVERHVGVIHGYEQAIARHEATAAVAQRNARNALAIAQRSTNELRGAAVGAGVGAGASLLVNAAITTVSLPVGIGVTLVGALIGAEIGKNQ